MSENHSKPYYFNNFTPNNTHYSQLTLPLLRIPAHVIDPNYFNASLITISSKSGLMAITV